MSFLAFIRANFRPLAFGGLHSFFSTPGQTSVMGLFIASFAASFGLDAATMGSFHLITTLGAAATLLFLGHWIDHMRLVHYSAAVIVSLALACFAFAASFNVVTFLLALYVLRLCGYGLMNHVEATATARMFSADRGRALSITSLGTPLSHFLFPPVAVWGIANLGWRWTYVLFGAVALFVVLPVTQWLMHGARSPKPASSGRSPWRDFLAGLSLMAHSRYVYLVLPASMLPPFGATVIYFYISYIAADRGWPLSLVAVSFIGTATMSIVGLIASGFIIDRFTARRLFRFQWIPIVAALLVLASVHEPWAMVVSYACIGFGAGLTRTTSTAIWAEKFGVEKLGVIRSASTMFLVLASAISPLVFGAFLSLGMSISEALFAVAAMGLVAILGPFFAEWRGIR